MKQKIIPRTVNELVLSLVEIKQLESPFYESNGEEAQEFYFRSRDGKSLFYFIKREQDKNYIIQFEETARKPHSVCEIRVYDANSRRCNSQTLMPEPEEIFLTEFKASNYIQIQASVVRLAKTMMEHPHLEEYLSQHINHTQNRRYIQ